MYSRLMCGAGRFGTFLKANKIHFICGENAAKYRRNKKCAKPFGLKIRLCRLGRNQFCTKAREKVAQ